MAAAGPIMMAGGAGVQMVSALQKAQAESTAARYNAETAEQNAKQAQDKAREDERQFRQQTKKQLGTMRANYGASGVTMEGSPLDVLESSAANAELDALKIRQTGEAKANAFRGEARLERFKGDYALKAGKLSAASALLSGGGQMAGAMG